MVSFESKENAGITHLLEHIITESWKNVEQKDAQIIGRKKEY